MRRPGVQLLLLLQVILLVQTAATAAFISTTAAARAFFASFSAGLRLHPRRSTSTMARAAAAAAAPTRRHASSALRTVGPVSASSAAAPVRRSSRLLSTLNDGDGASAAAASSSGSSKKKGAAKGSKSQKEKEGHVDEPAAPALKKRGRPRKETSIATEPERGAANTAAIVTTLAVSSSSPELVVEVEGEAPRRRTKRRTSKDSDVSDAPSDATAAATAAALLLEEEVEEMSGPPSLYPLWERRLEGKDGIGFVFGVDEAGRGPLAGPVVAAACYIPSHVVIPGIQDSKAMDEAAREAAYAGIVAAEGQGVRWAVQAVDHARIDEINILQATMEAMRGALATAVARHGPTDAAASFALVDGNRVPSDLPAPLAGADCVVKGDSKVRCIAAASILAKVTRDRIMLEYHAQYPHYDFAQHKGYPTPAHKAALLRHGPCPIHRMTFKPIRK